MSKYSVTSHDTGLLIFSNLVLMAISYFFFLFFPPYSLNSVCVRDDDLNRNC